MTRDAGGLTERNFYTQRPLHREAFTQNSLYTQSFSKQKPLHAGAFRHSSFYSQCQNYRTEPGVQKYGKIPYLRTPPDPDSARIRIHSIIKFPRSIIKFPRSIITARTDVLPGKVRFDCAGPMFCEIPRVVRLGKRMTNFFPHFINIIIIIIFPIECKVKRG